MFWKHALCNNRQGKWGRVLKDNSQPHCAKQEQLELVGSENKLPYPPTPPPPPPPPIPTPPPHNYPYYGVISDPIHFIARQSQSYKFENFIILQ